MFDFKFNKAFYNSTELLKVVPVPKATFYSWQADWISKGNDPKLMGKILVKGTSTIFWDGAIYLNWLYENKFNMETKYDYEAADKKKAVLVISKLKQQEE